MLSTFSVVCQDLFKFIKIHAPILILLHCENIIDHHRRYHSVAKILNVSKKISFRKAHTFLYLVILAHVYSNCKVVNSDCNSDTN